MGAVYSCLTSIVHAIGGLIMGLFRAIGAALAAVVRAVESESRALAALRPCFGHHADHPLPLFANSRLLGHHRLHHLPRLRRRTQKGREDQGLISAREEGVRRDT
ncbi:hypothetical protein BDZ90DRAFT_230006 [Jaminaea rosea]|uniref:Uncharacterized protein n=1 Tax=Jaminaea rosea TaxID=1569628 RepID=A0A316V0D2_9BASI|nr:hypothetical protein BDZ90DRAFT_230006 [Jaminaea rosea]PWN31009.1 hypothetical protein BDZ90DRAFT_230006 [Jaminaea rosea]